MRQTVLVIAICVGFVGCGGGDYTQISEEDIASVNSTATAAMETKPPAESQAAAEPAPPATAIPAEEPSAEPPPPKKKYKPQSTSTGRTGGMIKGVLGARNRNTGSNNGKQLALAMMQNDRVPPQAIVSSEGTPLLSWRVKLMQTLDGNLYRAFNHKVAWDHPDNMKLVEKMPAFFEAGYPLEDGHTVMLAVVGDDTMFPDPARVKKAKRGLAMDECRDGASRTILFVIGHPERAVPWTKPQDLEFNPDNPGDGLVGPDGTMLAVFCDGSVRRLSGLDNATIKAILTRKGGEVVGSLE